MWKDVERDVVPFEIRCVLLQAQALQQIPHRATPRRHCLSWADPRPTLGATPLWRGYGWLLLLLLLLHALLISVPQSSFPQQVSATIDLLLAIVSCLVVCALVLRVVDLFLQAKKTFHYNFFA